MKNIYICILSVALLCSCNNQLTITPPANNNQGGKELTKNIDEFLSGTASRYANNYIPTDFVAFVSASKSTPLDTDFIEAYSDNFGRYSTKSNLMLSKSPYTLKLGGSVINEKFVKTKSGQSDLSENFGKVAKFDFIKMATKSNIIDTTVTLYIPELVNITSPAIRPGRSPYPPCYYKNFILRWNADKNNTNGLIVSVEWHGTVLHGETSNHNMSIRRTDFIEEDNGEIVLKERMFEDIPNTALVYITLLRGNLENVAVDDYSYKVGAFSNVRLPIILIREIKQINKNKL